MRGFFCCWMKTETIINLEFELTKKCIKLFSQVVLKIDFQHCSWKSSRSDKKCPTANKFQPWNKCEHQSEWLEHFIIKKLYRFVVAVTRLNHVPMIWFSLTRKESFLLSGICCTSIPTFSLQCICWNKWKWTSVYPDSYRTNQNVCFRL